MRYLLTHRAPPVRKVVLVESGSRHLIENLLRNLYKSYGAAVEVDLVTCYVGLPETYEPSRGQVYRVGEYPGGEGRQRLYEALAAREHDLMGIVCSAEPIMTKWKWMLAARTGAKLFVLNENGDYFFVDHSNWRIIKHFVLFRAGLSGADAVDTISRLLLFPFTVTFLLLFAAAVHLRRKVRT